MSVSALSLILFPATQSSPQLHCHTSEQSFQLAKHFFAVLVSCCFSGLNQFAFSQMHTPAGSSEAVEYMHGDHVMMKASSIHVHQLFAPHFCQLYKPHAQPEGANVSA